jgi:predicted TIM-barrel fold metal-dependent hydrolase
VKALRPEETSEYLGVLQSLRASYPFYDTHVHPYEVLFDRFTYEDQKADSGVLSLSGKTYTAPTVTNFRFPEMGDFNDDPRSQRLQDISVMLLRKVYGNVGEQVFLDQMNLSGIDKVLLLPIAADSVSSVHFDSRMRWIKQFYRNEDKFWIAGSIPAALAGGEIRQFVEAQRKQYGIRALKCHPVVSGIDLSKDSRKQWLEELLTACHKSEIPLIIHGGRNNPYWGGSRGNFAALENLKDINMSLSKRPVILAHAGFHRCKIQEIEQHGLQMLDTMLQSHPNLYVDISGLTFEPLKLVLKTVAASRIIFGSDALYSSQWEAVTMTMHALKELRMPLEESFVQYASLNPRNTIFKDQ